MVDISAAVNVHTEGALCHVSIRSMLDAAQEARAAGLVVELLAAADGADALTLECLRAFPEIRVLETNFRDLGLARNALVSSARGQYVAFLDGDDLWSSNWLVRAHMAAANAAERIVWHPEVSLFFGQKQDAYWLAHPESTTIEGDWVTLGIRNQWTALCFATRTALFEVPYPRSEFEDGIGYEDWAWNSGVVALGYEHRTVKGTSHLIRVKPDSLVQRAQSARRLPPPSPLMRSRIGWATRIGTEGVSQA